MLQNTPTYAIKWGKYPCNTLNQSLTDLINKPTEPNLAGPIFTIKVAHHAITSLDNGEEVLLNGNLRVFTMA